MEKIMNNLVPLEYIYFINVPIKKTKYGSIIDLEPGVLENLAAKAVIQNNIPLRGKEIKFLRKTLGLSLEKFANKIDLVSSTIFRWENDENNRIGSANEVLVRCFMSEILGIEIQIKMSELIGKEIHDINVNVA